MVMGVPQDRRFSSRFGVTRRLRACWAGVGARGRRAADRRARPARRQRGARRRRQGDAARGRRRAARREHPARGERQDDEGRAASRAAREAWGARPARRRGSMRDAGRRPQQERGECQPVPTDADRPRIASVRPTRWYSSYVSPSPTPPARGPRAPRGRCDRSARTSGCPTQLRSARPRVCATSTSRSRSPPTFGAACRRTRCR
jgi:hypothetical protein